MFPHFVKRYIRKTTSIIKDTFYIMIRSTMKCNKCFKINYSFKTFNFLIFKLKNVKEFNQKPPYNKLNIYDAFNFYIREEVLVGDNKIYCNCCKQLTIDKQQQFIYSLPKVLIIILDRGKNNQDFKEEFQFPKVLDLSIGNYVINTPNNRNNTHFYLQSFITHLGQSASGGNFISYCRNGANEEFLCYNDSIVSKANVEQVMSSNISENIYENKTPYILVYHDM